MIYLYLFLVATIVFLVSTFFGVALFALFAIFIIWYTTLVLLVANEWWDLNKK